MKKGSSMKTMKSKKRLAAAGLAVAVALAVAGCGTGGSAGPDPDVTTLWRIQDNAEGPLKEAAERFNETSEVGQVAYSGVAQDSYYERLRTAMNSNQRPGMFFNHGSGSIRDYVDADMLVDLQEAFDADPQLKEAFLPSMIDMVDMDGGTYGIPIGGTQPVILFYNKAVFDEVGITPPTSWDEMLEAIEVFKAAGIVPFSQPATQAWTLLMWWEYVLDRLAGPEVFQTIADGNWDEGWGDPAMLEATEMIESLVELGAFGDNYASIAYGEGGSETLIAEGDAAMYLMGSWAFTSFTLTQPEFTENNLGWVEFPAIEGGKGDPANVVGNPTTYLSVSTGANKETAFAFLSELYSDDYIDSLVAQGEVPVTVTGGERLDASPNPEFAKWQFERVAAAPSFTQSWDQAIPAQLSSPMLVEMQRLFLGQIDAQQFVDAVMDLD